MKTIHLVSSVSLLAMALLVSVSSCQDENLGFNSSANSSQVNNPSANGMANSAAPLNVDLQLFPKHYHLEDADKAVPMDETTPLFNKNGPMGGMHVPIMTPDGNHQVTLGEWNMISGTASVKCINAGTHVVMHLKGLIPNGVYTIWTLTYIEPGFDGISIPNNRISFGALGAIEGSKNSNSFTASSEGVASISVIRPEGRLLTAGAGSPNPHPEGVIPNCMGDVYETHLALAYHLDNQASAPGAPPTWAVQGWFQIFGSDL